jgi:hypothetical protein
MEGEEGEEGFVAATPDEEMIHYGITKTSEDHYYYGNYHYTNLADAIAQASREQSASDTLAAPEDLMARYGIMRRPVDVFRYRDFRYTSLGDALAQARQQRDAQGVGTFDPGATGGRASA